VLLLPSQLQRDKMAHGRSVNLRKVSLISSPTAKYRVNFLHVYYDNHYYPLPLYLSALVFCHSKLVYFTDAAEFVSWNLVRNWIRLSLQCLSLLLGLEMATVSERAGNKYKVVHIWPGQTVTCLHTNSPGHIWTTL
jgi:hypothetical protein